MVASPPLLSPQEWWDSALAGLDLSVQVQVKIVNHGLHVLLGVGVHVGSPLVLPGGLVIIAVDWWWVKSIQLLQSLLVDLRHSVTQQNVGCLAELSLPNVASDGSEAALALVHGLDRAVVVSIVDIVLWAVRGAVMIAVAAIAAGYLTVRPW